MEDTIKPLTKFATNSIADDKPIKALLKKMDKLEVELDTVTKWATKFNLIDVKKKRKRDTSA